MSICDGETPIYMPTVSKIMASNPMSISRGFGVHRDDSSQIEFNKFSTTWNNTTVKTIWYTLSNCSIEIIGAPIDNLWGAGNSKFELTDADDNIIGEGFLANGTATIDVERIVFATHTLTIYALGESRVYKIKPPVKIRLRYSDQPNQPPSLIVTPNPKLVTEPFSVELENIDSSVHRNVRVVQHQEIPIPKDWYDSLSEDSNIRLKFNNLRSNSFAEEFDSSTEIPVEMPTLDYFSPTLGSSEIHVDPELGYIMKFQINNLSPNIQVNSVHFQFSDGPRVPVDFKGDSGEIKFETPVQNRHISHSISGVLKIEPYHDNEEGIQVEQHIEDNISITAPETLFRDDNCNPCVRLTFRGDSSGLVIFTVKNQDEIDDIFDKNEIRNEIELPSGVHEFTLEDIRKRLPAIDHFFFGHMGQSICIEVQCIPYNNREVFSTITENFQVKREEQIIQKEPDEVSNSIENGDAVHWKLDYVSEYYPDVNLFKLSHCGREIQPKFEENLLSFEIEQPSYTEVEEDNTWFLHYGEKEVLSGHCSLPKISLTNESEELRYILDDEATILRCSNAIGINPNGQVNVEYQLEIVKQPEEVVCKTMLQLGDGKIAREIDDWIRQNHENTGIEFRLSKNNEYKLRISIPSRLNQQVFNTAITISDRDEIQPHDINRMATEFLKIWNGDPRNVRDIEWNDLRNMVCEIFVRSMPNFSNRDFHDRRRFSKMVKIIEEAEKDYWKKFYEYMKENVWNDTDDDRQDRLEDYYKRVKRQKPIHIFAGTTTETISETSEEDSIQEPEVDVEHKETEIEDVADPPHSNRQPEILPETRQENLVQEDIPDSTAPNEPVPPNLETQDKKETSEEDEIRNEIEEMRKRLYYKDDRPIFNKKSKQYRQKMRPIKNWAAPLMMKYPKLPWDRIDL